VAWEYPDEEDQERGQEVTEEVTSGIRVHPRHIRAARLCMNGCRVWYERHGLSWSEFVSNGTPVEWLESTGDKFALDVAKIARDEHGRG
jgi:hypothetical protein